MQKYIHKKKVASGPNILLPLRVLRGGSQLPRARQIIRVGGVLPLLNDLHNQRDIRRAEEVG